MRLLIVAETRMVHTQRWASALQRCGWQVAVLSVSQVPIEDVEVIPLTTPPPSWTRPRRWRSRYIHLFRSTIRRFEPDIVHLHYLHDYPLDRVAGRHTDLLACWRKPRPPLVISTWGADIIQDQWVPIDTEAERRHKVHLLRSADAVTATTHYLADCTAQYGGLERQDITVIPFGVDLSRFEGVRRDRSKNYPVVGLIKHLEPKYGVDYLLGAMPAVLERFPTARCVIVGRGSQEQALKKLEASLGLTGLIEWSGAIDNAQVPAALAKMDVFAMPSISPSETFGVTAVEAQAAGVPVVFSDLPGVREAVVDGVGGLAVPPANARALADAICSVLGNEQLHRKLSAGGRETARQRFDFNRNVSQMEQVYERAVADTCCTAV